MSFFNFGKNFPMDFLDPKFSVIKAFIFDVDGVLSSASSPLDEFGDPVRTTNVRDGFAIRIAIKCGYPVAIITGGFQERVKLRFRKLGVVHFYENSGNKVDCLNDFMVQTGIKAEEILFMGDDLVDYQSMRMVGMPVCPADAVREIKGISLYVSGVNGGDGCARDVIELTLRHQHKWDSEALLYSQIF